MAEYDFNSAVSEEVKHLLKGKLPVYEGQTGSTDVSLNTRANRYNAEFQKDKSAIGMSYHGNANGNKKTRGFGVFYWQGSAKAKKLAEMVLAEYKKEFPDLPIWGSGIFASKVGDWTNFAILRETAAPFILIEWEFFTNDDARKLMRTSEYRKRCGKVAAKVACQWYGISFEEEPNPVLVVKPAAPKPTEKPKEEPKVTYQKDAQPSRSLAPEFNKAKAMGITDGTYPQRPATREEVAVMVLRAAELIKGK